MQQQNEIRHHYNPNSDTLNLYIGRASSFYSDEAINGVFIIRDEDTDDVIGVEIMDFSRRNKDRLKQLVPIYFDYESVNN